MILLLLEILAIYWLSDVISGIYHYATDHGWNIKQQVDLFQRHHRHPEEFGLNWYPFAGAIPFLLLGFVWNIFFVFAFCTAFIEIPHWLAHKGISNQVVDFLRRIGFLISVEQHDLHHCGEFDQNFCIVTGWNNWWFNRLVRACPIPVREVK